MWMVLGATLSFSLMSALVRASSGHFRAEHLVFYRCVLQCLCTFPWVRSFWPSPGELLPMVRVHFVRGAVGIFSMAMLFYALGRLPLGLVSLLTMTSVLWSFVFGWLFLNERPRKTHLWLSLVACVGFGWTVIPQDGAAGWQAPWDGVIAALIGGFSMGVAYTLVRQMRRTRSTVEIVFWFGLVGLVLTTPVFFVDPSWPTDPSHFALLGGIGLFALGGQFLMTGGFRYTPMLQGSLCSMSGSVWNLLLGLWLFAEMPPAAFWPGALVAGGAVVGLMLTRTRTV